jgi:putative restriction endonuclease
MKRNNWTHEETIVAFNVYCKIPFKKSSKTHPTIIKYAKIIGRSPSALNMKIGNLGRLDPDLRKDGIVGLSNGSKTEEVVWNEFHGNWEKLAYESELLIAKFSNQPIENIVEINDEDEENIKMGLDKTVVVKRRVNQSFFRSTILSAYHLKCAITGLSLPKLLVAAHIKPWSEDEINRLNPRNGICLNQLHHGAFDEGYFTITPDFEVKISPFLRDYKDDASVLDFFFKYDKQKISLPDKFLPNK